MDRTLILVKPDAFARNLTGEIIARFERKGLRIVALRHMTMDTQLAEQHYAEHNGKPFFGELVSFITSGPLVAMVLEGEEAVRAARQVIGATNPLEATTGSIRGDFAVAVHAPGELVLGADTDVALDGDILGKPGDEDAAGRFLARLSGRTHEVVGGIVLARGGEVLATAVERTSVTFRTLDRATLEWYVRSREWEGRAGGYAVQGAGQALVTRIDGEHSNVVGLPVGLLLALLPDLLVVH